MLQLSRFLKFHPVACRVTLKWLELRENTEHLNQNESSCSFSRSLYCWTRLLGISKALDNLPREISWHIDLFTINMCVCVSVYVHVWVCVCVRVLKRTNERERERERERTTEKRRVCESVRVWACVYVCGACVCVCAHFCPCVCSVLLCALWCELLYALLHALLCACVLVCFSACVLVFLCAIVLVCVCYACALHIEGWVGGGVLTCVNRSRMRFVRNTIACYATPA